jgi:hypothetical protein
MCVKEEYTITYIYWVHECKSMKEYGVYNERKFVFEDILAPLVHGFE